jgi:hypothetical protein
MPGIVVDCPTHVSRSQGQKFSTLSLVVVPIRQELYLIYILLLDMTLAASVQYEALNER